MALIESGAKAPAFNLETIGGKKVSLADFKGEYLVVFFYPRDNTPGCTTEACEFQDTMQEFKKLGATVVGVSKDSVDSHEKFAKKYGLRFQLLSDPEGTVIEKYGAWGEKLNYGKKYMGILRSTVVIDPKGKVVRVFDKVKVKGHAKEVIACLKELQAS